MTTQVTKLPTAYAPAGFTSRLAATLAAGADGAQASTAVSVAANASALFSFSTTGALASFAVEVSRDAGATWTGLETLTLQAGHSPTVRMYTPTEAVQIRVTAWSGFSGATVAVASSVL